MPAHLLAVENNGVLSTMLVPAFAEQFRGMSENEIDRMMQSFALHNCVQREELAQLIRSLCVERRERS